MKLSDLGAALNALTDEERHDFLDEPADGPALCERLLVVLARRVGVDVECWRDDRRDALIPGQWCVRWHDDGWTRFYTGVDESRIRAITEAIEATRP